MIEGRARLYISGVRSGFEEPRAAHTRFRSLRLCPECGGYLLTSGNGRFLCEVCGRRDEQDVAPLRAAGLAYANPNEWGPAYWMKRGRRRTE